MSPVKELAHLQVKSHVFIRNTGAKLSLHCQTDGQTDIQRGILKYLQICQGIKGIFMALKFTVNMDLNWIIDQKRKFTEFVTNISCSLHKIFLSLHL